MTVLVDPSITNIVVYPEVVVGEVKAAYILFVTWLTAIPALLHLEVSVAGAQLTGSSGHDGVGRAVHHVHSRNAVFLNVDSFSHGVDGDLCGAAGAR